MEQFAQAVQGWHDFYIMVGTAAATLMGLLFVSLSLNIDAILKKANSDLRELAAQTFTNFLCMLMFAVLFLIPLQGPNGLGLPLLGIDAVGLLITVRRLRQMTRYRPRVWRSAILARRFALPTLCFGSLTVVAMSILLGKTGGIYWLVPVMILLIWDASVNAWDLLLQLRAAPQEL